MTPGVAFVTTLVGEIMHMGIVLLLTHPLLARRRGGEGHRAPP